MYGVSGLFGPALESEVFLSSAAKAGLSGCLSLTGPLNDASRLYKIFSPNPHDFLLPDSAVLLFTTLYPRFSSVYTSILIV